MVIAPNIIPQRCFSVSPFKNCSMQCAANLFFDFKVHTVTIVRTCMGERHGSGEKENTIFLFNLYNSSLSNCGTPQELFPKSIIEKFSASKREKYEKFIQRWTSSVCDNDVEVKDLDEVEGQTSLTYTTTSAESLRQD
ncbi:hypothetical protein HELRODRAFT_172162 [Helobdella robusta]|uniref:Uncharacterized protein n=1 Tax=Helobdella robusta TaxID=6412 RepID=T1F535_HELRO|nr:hypothetical protein HELRODRAFT_172162 [Helobdella robusta]ESO04515.1 hypothetical protein HELRODRAFT_172162 [Helobdella robusta]